MRSLLQCEQLLIKFDAIQSNVGFTEAGAVIPSKVEKQDAYGMCKASAIDKEWFEQAAHLEAWCIGKTVEEVLVTSLNNGYPTDAALVTGCTMGISDYLLVLQKAAELAKEYICRKRKCAPGDRQAMPKSPRLRAFVFRVWKRFPIVDIKKSISQK